MPQTDANIGRKGVLLQTQHERSRYTKCRSTRVIPVCSFRMTRSENDCPWRELLPATARNYHNQSCTRWKVLSTTTVSNVHPPNPRTRTCFRMRCRKLLLLSY